MKGIEMTGKHRPYAVCLLAFLGAGWMDAYFMPSHAFAQPAAPPGGGIPASGQAAAADPDRQVIQALEKEVFSPTLSAAEVDKLLADLRGPAPGRRR